MSWQLTLKDSWKLPRSSFAYTWAAFPVHHQWGGYVDGVLLLEYGFDRSLQLLCNFFCIRHPNCFLAHMAPPAIISLKHHVESAHRVVDHCHGPPATTSWSFGYLINLLTTSYGSSQSQSPPTICRLKLLNRPRLLHCSQILNSSRSFANDFAARRSHLAQHASVLGYTVTRWLVCVCVACVQQCCVRVLCVCVWPCAHMRQCCVSVCLCVSENVLVW